MFSLIRQPLVYMGPLRDQLTDFVKKKYYSDNTPEMKPPEKDVEFGFVGSFGRRSCTPRGLRAEFIGQMVMVEGIVTKISTPHPKAVFTIHYCEATNRVFFREYRDALSLSGPPTGTTYPTVVCAFILFSFFFYSPRLHFTFKYFLG